MGDREEEDEQVANVFRPLQVCAACFAAFNHGGNDVGNCIGPLVTIYVMYVYPLEWLPNLESNSHISWKLWGGFGIGTVTPPRAPGGANNGVKDHANDTIPGFCRSYLVKFCPYALHSHGHPNVNNPMPGDGPGGSWDSQGLGGQWFIGGGVDTVNISVFKRIVLAWVITIFCSGGVSMALYSVLRMIFINSDFAGS